MVFAVAGCIVTFILAVVLLEKITCVPKKVSKVSLALTSNKMLHQLMAIANVVMLLACVLLPLVRTTLTF